MSLIWSNIQSHLEAPGTCGVYQYWHEGEILYIGKAINLKARLASHAQNARLDERERSIVAGATVIKYTEVDTEFKALLLESQLIRQHQPPYNRAWKDDKSYLYIVVNLGDPFPRPHLARAHELKSGNWHLTSKLKIFGPFPNTYVAEEILRVIRRLIPFCALKRVGQHACFYSKIGLCSPCPAHILQLEDSHLQHTLAQQYRRQIRQVVKILEGKIDPVIRELTRAMKQAAAKQEFETALGLQHKIDRFTRYIQTHSFRDNQVIYNSSETKIAALQELLKSYVLNLKSLHRLECYDASNSALHDATVSLVVMTDGLLDRGEYRRFRIKNPRARSDFDRLAEALTRRLKRVGTDRPAWARPDLIVIDGGVPQLRRLQRVFDQLPTPIPYLGLAKHPDRLIIPNPDGTFATLPTPSDNPAILLLGQLRDEAHRFANSYRRLLESRRTGI